MTQEERLKIYHDKVKELEDFCGVSLGLAQHMIYTNDTLLAWAYSDRPMEDLPTVD